MKYWIFGAGDFGKECYEKYHAEVDFCGFIDNDERKNNTSYCGGGLHVVSYNKFKTTFDKSTERIIIASCYLSEMYAQLINDGYENYVEKAYTKIKGLSSLENCWNKNINSQCGEELWLQSYFRKHYPADYKGTYIDVGAFHPFYASNTRWAYDAGWRGVNIDANIDCIKMFEKFRPEDKNIYCGVSDTKGELEFLLYNSMEMCTFDQTLYKDKLKVREVRKVPVKTLNEILKENNIQSIDFLDIDVEGLEEKIIMSFDWKKYSPRCVLIEILHMNSIEEILLTEIHKKMTAEGYRLANYAMLTAMYVNK